MKYEYCIFIMRAQPFHNAHEALIKMALQKGEQVVVIFGSYKKSPDPKNPWTGEQREQMMRESFTEAENARIKVILMRDYLYNDMLWIADLTQKVSEITEDSTSICLLGHEHDRSSYYLKLFPQWELVNVNNIDEFPHATEIRDLYFTHDVRYKNFVPAKTALFLEEFKKTETFKNLKTSYDALVEYKLMWEGAPFPPTFVTVDAVVVKSGHILVVRRGGNYGKGQIALPGGFVNQDERIKDAAIRELKEETAIKLPKDDLKNAIVDERVFDHPNRSLRTGRTISHAFLLDLKSGALPQVKGNDDAAKSWWMPLREFYSREEEFFEDHYHIISYFCSRGI